MLPHNLIIAGVGGQGVYGLLRVIQRACRTLGFPCHSAIYKGGAQRLGSVTARARIIAHGEALAPRLSHDIPPGRLDLLLALEPWEGLRHHALFTERTSVVANTVATPFFNERFNGPERDDPVALLKNSVATVVARPYADDADERFADRRMAAVLMACDAALRGWLPLEETDIIQACLAELPCSPDVRNRLDQAGPTVLEV